MESGDGTLSAVRVFCAPPAEGDATVTGSLVAPKPGPKGRGIPAVNEDRALAASTAMTAIARRDWAIRRLRIERTQRAVALGSTFSRQCAYFNIVAGRHAIGGWLDSRTNAPTLGSRIRYWWSNSGMVFASRRARITFPTE